MLNLPHMLKVQVEHQNYLEKLELPTSEEIVAIAKVQERREEEILKKYNTVGDDDVGAQQPEKQEAAKTIQVSMVWDNPSTNTELSFCIIAYV